MKAVLKDARRLAKGLSSEKKAFIDELCSEIESLAKELEELQARGEVSLQGQHNGMVREVQYSIDGGDYYNAGGIIVMSVGG